MEAKFADIPDELWERIEHLIPPHKSRLKGGRPPVPDRVVLAGIIYRMKTGCQWKALPSKFGSGSTCHLRFQAWVGAGVFASIFAALVEHYDLKRGIKWEWASLDSATVKAPKGGTKPVRIQQTALKAVQNATC